MNEEFAVEPTAFENAFQLKYVLEKFGFHRGRFIVGFPSKWITLVHDHSLRFPEIEQAKARSLLKKAKESNLVVNSGELGFEPSLPWIDNAHHVSMTHNPFNGVIAAKSNSFTYPTVNEVYEMDDDFFGASNDVRIVGTAENYSRIARRLLQMSHEVAFVDPYLRLERPACEKVVKSFLAIAQQGKCQNFVFWTREKIAAKAYRCMLEEKYKPSLAPKSTLTVNLVNDEGSAEKMHARLLLSTLGGLRFDHGFEEFDDGRRVDISLVSEQAHDFHCCWYLDRNSLNDFVMVGNPYNISG
jgi:hypothetical protein